MAFPILEVNVGSAVEERPAHFYVSTLGCPEQCCMSVTIVFVDLGAIVYQEFDQIEVARRCSRDQRRRVLPI